MELFTVFSFPEPLWKYNENIMKMLETACAYAGIDHNDTDSRTLMQEILDSLPSRYPPRSTWRQVPLTWSDGIPVADGEVLPGAMAAGFLQRAGSIILMAITLGPAFDRDVRRLALTDMTRSLFLNAAGAAFVDQELDRVQAEIETSLGRHLSERFSPGYGDLPLAMQRFMERELNLSGRLGIHLLDTLLMVPEKSITAMAGVFDTPQPQSIRGCEVCTLYPCALAKKGQTCGK